MKNRIEYIYFPSYLLQSTYWDDYDIDNLIVQRTTDKRLFIIRGFHSGYLKRDFCPRDVLMCMMLSAGWEEGGLLIYDHRSCILSGAS
jgi:hypothetical protein